MTPDPLDAVDLLDPLMNSPKQDLADRTLGGETNREIDFGFGSVVRARGLVVRWE